MRQSRQRRGEGGRGRRVQAVGGLQPDLDVRMAGVEAGSGDRAALRPCARAIASSSVWTLSPAAGRQGLTVTTTRASGSTSPSPASAPIDPGSGRCHVALRGPASPAPSSTWPRARSTTACPAAGRRRGRRRRGEGRRSAMSGQPTGAPSAVSVEERRRAGDALRRGDARRSAPSSPRRRSARAPRGPRRPRRWRGPGRRARRRCAASAADPPTSLLRRSRRGRR